MHPRHTLEEELGGSHVQPVIRLHHLRTNTFVNTRAEFAGGLCIAAIVMTSCRSPLPIIPRNPILLYSLERTDLLAQLFPTER